MLMQRHLTRPSLADVMVREGILPRRTVDQVVARLGGSTAALGQTLVEEGTISEAQLAQALAAQYGLPYDPLTGFRVDSEFYHTISVKLMRRHPFVPVKDEAGALTIAISDPQNLLALDERFVGSSGLMVGPGDQLWVWFSRKPTQAAPTKWGWGLEVYRDQVNGADS